MLTCKMHFILWLFHEHSFQKASRFHFFTLTPYCLLDCNIFQYNKRQRNIFFCKTNFLSSDFCFATSIILHAGFALQIFYNEKHSAAFIYTYQLLLVTLIPQFIVSVTHHISICFILLLLRNKVASLCRVLMFQLY